MFTCGLNPFRMALTARTFFFLPLVTLTQCGTTILDDCTKSGSFWMPWSSWRSVCVCALSMSWSGQWACPPWTCDTGSWCWWSRHASVGDASATGSCDGSASCISHTENGKTKKEIHLISLYTYADKHQRQYQGVQRVELAWEDHGYSLKGLWGWSSAATDVPLSKALNPLLL